MASSGEPVVLPDLGEGVTEAYVVSWLVDVGDRVEVGTPVVEIVTDKANVDVAAECAGVLIEKRFEPEARVGVGEVMAVIAPSDVT